MSFRHATLLLLFPALLGTTYASADSAPHLTLADAQLVMAAAVDYAHEHQAPGAAIAVVDEGGHLVLLQRLDNTFAAAPEISEGKARTAALFRKPTRDFERLVNDGRVTMVGLSAIVGFTPLQGGVPLLIDGHVVGAIGVSGAASAAQDDEIAQAASERLGQRTADATDAVLLDHKEVAAAFAAGAPLVENGSYKVHASRRDGAGEAEIHLNDTDVFYVLDGRATFVTGGALIDGHETGPAELRGSRIDGGNVRQLARGDVVVVPEGVPHWFKNVSAPVTYFVVKTSR